MGGTVVNQGFTSLSGWSMEINLIVPLTSKCMIFAFWINQTFLLFQMFFLTYTMTEL